LTKIREAGGSPSVALNPHTPVEMIENVLDLVDHVLVMTVNPGFGGQSYIPTMIDKIRKIRKLGVDRGLDFDIEVDGGVKVSPMLMGNLVEVVMQFNHFFQTQ
jgi:ribulose-phosphate 3-epimerase